MPRVGYFKGTTTVDATQNSSLETLTQAVASLETQLGSKADASDLSTLQTSVAAKASKTYVDSELAGKADASSLASLSASVATISNDVSSNSSSISSLQSSVTSNSGDISSLSSTLAGVSDQVDANHSAVSEFVLAVKDIMYISNADDSGEFNYEAFE